MRANVDRVFLSGIAVLVLWGLACIQPRAEEQDMAALAAAMKDATATMEKGLESAARRGRPISAKFEVDDGELELSVYVDGGIGLREILVNPQSGTAMGATLITEGGDLKDAKEQSAAMDKAKVTLLTSAQHAVAANPGARVVSVFPELQSGHAVAIVTLLNGDKFTKVTEVLD
jgi:hypothetical protein